MSDKPFAATAQRLRKAREEGNLPKAQELATLASFVGVAAAIVGFVPAVTASMAAFFIEACGTIRHLPARDLPQLTPFLPYITASARAIGCALAFGGALSCAVALSATRAALTGVTVKLERIAPGPHLQQLFSVATCTALARASGSACLAMLLILPFASAMVAGSIGLRTPLDSTALAWHYTVAVLAALAGVGLAVAAIEVIVSLRKRSEKLRMTHDEVRRESKEQQGDPHLRGLRKRRHRALLRGGIAAVKRATVVITNPTHLAIALLYAPPEVPVPRVVVRAADELAAEVRKTAREEGVPCVEHVALARRLFRECDEGDAVPLETYALVAPIIAAVMRAQEQAMP